MALAVDAAGKVAANPKTGKIAGGTSGGGGAAALREALGANDLVPSVGKQAVPGTESLDKVLKRSANYMPVQTKTQRSSAIPEVSTASIATPVSIGDTRARSDSVIPSYGSQQPEGLSGSSGFEPAKASTPVNMGEISNAVARSVGLDPEHVSEQSQWEQQRAEDEGREVRTQNYWGEDYKEGGGTLGSLDNQLDMMGNTQSNDAYVRAAIAAGADPDEMYDIMHRNQYAALSLPWGLSSDQRTSADQGGLLAGSTTIDDGTYDYDHMTADNMTGTQYLKYAQMGMGGRPVNEIDPTQVYSKRRELINYGFVPFTPDQTSYANMVIDNAMDAPSRLGAEIGSLRTKIPGKLNDDYGIRIGNKLVSGSDFDRLGGAYINQTEWKNQFDPSVLEFPIPDIDGNMTYHYGYLDSVIDYGDGIYELGFTDGSTVEVGQDFYDSVSDENGSVSLNDFTPVTRSEAMGDFPEVTDENRYDLITIPDLVMPDGTTLTYEEAQDIYFDRDVEDNPDDPYDDDITYDLSKTIIPTLDNRPSRLNGEVFGENGQVNFGSLANNVVDWTLGSIPISIDIGKSPWLYALSNASSSMSGIDPGTYDPSVDSYGLAYGNFDDAGNLRYGVTTPEGEIDPSLADEMQFWNMLGNAAVPLTEELVGPVGEELIPVRKLLGGGLPSSPTTRQVLGDFLIGMAEEGIEEDLGNIFDELTSYGPRGMFANQAVDENGRPMYDVTGHQVRDYSTPLGQRLRNAGNLQELANAFAGGALVDAALQTNPLMPKNLWSNLGNVRQNNEIRRQLGIDRYMDPRERRHQDVSEDYLSQFNDER